MLRQPILHAASYHRNGWSNIASKRVKHTGNTRQKSTVCSAQGIGDMKKSPRLCTLLAVFMIAGLVLYVQGIVSTSSATHHTDESGYLNACVHDLERSASSLNSLAQAVGVKGVSALQRVVHISYEVRPLASFGGLGGAVESMLVGHSGTAVVVLPAFGYIRQGKDDTSADAVNKVLHWFSHDVACGTPGLSSVGSELGGKLSYEFYVRSGPGNSLAVLVQPPSELDYFAQVRSRQDLYPVPGPESGAVALRVFAQGAAIALAALCPATPAAGGGVGVDVGGGPSCLGAVFHGANMGRALIAARQLPADPRQVLQVSPELRMLYFIHDGLSEISVFLNEIDVIERLGAEQLRGAVALEGGRQSTRSPDTRDTAESPAGYLLPGLQALALSAKMVGSPVALSMSALAALHADAIAAVSPSLGKVLLPGGEVLAPGSASRALLAMHRAGRLWAIPPVTSAPDPALGLPSVDQGKLDPEGAAQRLWAAKARARTELLGEGFSGELAPAGSAEGRRFVVLFVGRFEANKGAAMVVPVGREVCEQGGHTVVMSTGPQDEVGRRAWEDLHAWREASPQCVTLVGGRDQVRGRLARAAADVCLVPSWLEGYGLVASEALQHGCFLVASDTTGVGDIAQAVDAPNLSKRWIVPSKVLRLHPELDMFSNLQPEEQGGLGTSVVWPPQNATECPFHFARSFPIANGRGSRLPGEMHAAMAAFSTARSAAVSILRGVQDLRRCGPSVAARHAIRAATMMPTAQSTAGRVCDALNGRHAREEAPGRRGPDKLRQAISDFFLAGTASAAVQRLGFDGRRVPVLWRLNDRRALCGSTNMRLVASSAPEVTAAFIGRQATAPKEQGAPAGMAAMVIQLGPAESLNLERGIVRSVRHSVVVDQFSEDDSIRSGPGVAQLVCLGNATGFVEARIDVRLLDSATSRANLRLWVSIRGGTVLRQEVGLLGRRYGGNLTIAARLDVGVTDDRAVVGVDVLTGTKGATLVISDAVVTTREVPSSVTYPKPHQSDSRTDA